MKTHFTPGPWRCVECEFGDYQTGEIGFVVSSEAEKMVASVLNCRLIAAAPDLLVALQALTATARTFRNVPQAEQEWTPIDDEALDAAFAAIARATGNES